MSLFYCVLGVQIAIIIKTYLAALNNRIVLFFNNQISDMMFTVDAKQKKKLFNFMWAPEWHSTETDERIKLYNNIQLSVLCHSGGFFTVLLFWLPLIIGLIVNKPSCL